MAVTQLARKKRVNRKKSAARTNSIKLLSATPVIKNVDIEEIKKSFAAAKSANKSKKSSVAEKPTETEVA